MIERTATLKTLEGDVIPLPLKKEDGQFLQLTISSKWVDENGNGMYSGNDLITVHVRRSSIDKVEFFKNGPPEKIVNTLPQAETVEQLAVRLLEMLGVKLGE